MTDASSTHRRVCALSVNPSLDLVQAQQSDLHISRIISMKQRGQAKPSLATITDPTLKNCGTLIMIAFLFATVYELGLSATVHRIQIMWLLYPTLYAKQF